MAHRNKEEHEKVVNEDEVSLKSFKSYPSSDDDKTKIIDGEKVVEDFHMYDSEDDDDEDDEEEKDEDEE